MTEQSKTIFTLPAKTISLFPTTCGERQNSRFKKKNGVHLLVRCRHKAKGYFHFFLMGGNGYCYRSWPLRRKITDSSLSLSPSFLYLVIRERQIRQTSSVHSSAPCSCPIGPEDRVYSYSYKKLILSLLKSQNFFSKCCLLRNWITVMMPSNHAKSS